jgi:hypothetical protein
VFCVSKTQSAKIGPITNKLLYEKHKKSETFLSAAVIDQHRLGDIFCAKNYCTFSPPHKNTPFGLLGTSGPHNHRPASVPCDPSCSIYRDPAVAPTALARKPGAGALPVRRSRQRAPPRARRAPPRAQSQRPGPKAVSLRGAPVQCIALAAIVFALLIADSLLWQPSVAATALPPRC